MNIIYLHTHDSGRYIDPRLAPLPLPNIRALAQSSATMTNAFCAAPTCSPSRAALLTGRTPHAVGMTGLAHRGFRFHDYRAHLNSCLGQQGVKRVLCGVQHVAPNKAELGYDRVLDSQEDYFSIEGIVPETLDRENAERVAAFLRGRAAGTGTAPGSETDGTRTAGGNVAGARPLFLSFGLLSTHRPFPETPPDDSAPDTTSQAAPGGGRAAPAGHSDSPGTGNHSPPWHIPDTPETRRDMGRFMASLGVVDRAVGTVVRAVQEAGLWENTAIVLTTDHGPPFPEMKGTLYDGGMAVGLVVRVPGVADDGRTENALVSQLDLFPTLCELAGAEPPQDTEGSSLLPLLRGESTAVREVCHAETNYHAVYEPARAIRTARYKLIRRFGEELTPHPANVDDSAAKEAVAGMGYFERRKPREELFDLAHDPSESENLLKSPAYGEVYRDLAGRLARWMRETGDPLLHGPVPRPARARVNRPEAYSAEEPTEK